MNQLDVILIFIILLSVTIGLRRGFIRVLISIVGLYFTVVVAGYAYGPMGEILSRSLSRLGIHIGITAGHNFIYLVVVVAMTIVVESVSRSTFEETRIQRLNNLDNLLGGIVGVFYGILWASLFLVAPQYGITQSGGAWSTAVHQSILVPKLNRVFQDAVLDIVRILFVGGTPELYLNRTSLRVSYHFLNLASLCRFPV